MTIFYAYLKLEVLKSLFFLSFFVLFLLLM